MAWAHGSNSLSRFPPYSRSCFTGRFHLSDHSVKSSFARPASPRDIGYRYRYFDRGAIHRRIFADLRYKAAVERAKQGLASFVILPDRGPVLSAFHIVRGGNAGDGFTHTWIGRRRVGALEGEKGMIRDGRDIFPLGVTVRLAGDGFPERERLN